MKKIKKISLPAFAVCVFAVLSVQNAFTQGTADPSLILHLSFDELHGNRVLDHSQYRNHGTLVGNPQLVNGKFGKALKLNGSSDWVEVPHDDSLTVDENVTVMAWIQTPRHQGPSGASWQGILAKSDFPRSYSFYTEAGGSLHLSVGNFVGSDSRTKVVLNTWQHVVAQVDNDWHRYWINGKNAGNFHLNARLPGTADIRSVLIGRTHEGNREFLGLIDEVRIYNRALSEGEIIALMRNEPQAIAGWKDTSPKPGDTARFSGNFDDPFEGNALQNPNWRWRNEPDHWDIGRTRTDSLHIEGEINRDLWLSDTTHFLYQETTADAFDVETHFFAKSNTSSGVAGLVVKSPGDDNWVTLKLWTRGPTNAVIQYQTKGNGLADDMWVEPTPGDTEMFLRLRKTGNTYTGWYKTRSPDPWIDVGTRHFVLTPPLQLGIYAGVATNSGTLTVDYEYFRSRLSTDPDPTSDPSVRTRPVTDVNGDGSVNILDLTAVAQRFGQRGENDADVNRDGTVDISDLVLVAWALGQTAAPSLVDRKLLENFTVADVRQWVSAAAQIRSTDIRYQEGVLILEQLLAVLTPTENMLLPNYPNPFNPETWIPYHLANPADVTVTIYSIEGEVVRRLDVGHQGPGFYQNKARAVYWDGKNGLGEPVSSGIYFYELTASDFTATRKMIIKK